MQNQDKAIISMSNGAVDHTGKEGVFVLNTAGVAVLVSSATTPGPFGVIVAGGPANGNDSVAVAGAPGIYNVLVGGTGATAGSFGTLLAAGTVQNDSGSGARMQVCKFITTAAAASFAQAVLIAPVFSAAGAISSTAG